MYRKLFLIAILFITFFSPNIIKADSLVTSEINEIEEVVDEAEDLESSEKNSEEEKEQDTDKNLKEPIEIDEAEQSKKIESPGKSEEIEKPEITKEKDSELKNSTISNQERKIELNAVSEKLTGYALKQPVAIYESTSRSSKVLKEYNYGHMLIYRNYDDSKDWYEATVYVSGVAKKGYIHASDVGESKNIPSVNGLALKNKTAVYSNTNKSSSVLKNYLLGSKLIYRTHSKDWFSATVYVKGKAHTGYIHAKDVETAVSDQITLQGVGVSNLVKVYKSGSRSSDTWKSYLYGSTLKYKTFTKNWYEATVIINGKSQTGYIAKKDVGALNTRLTSYAQKTQTNVYSSTSRNSSVLKGYKSGTKLKYQAYNKNWFKATVYINGKAKTGFIHHTDVGPTKPVTHEFGYGVKSSVVVYASTSRNTKKLKSYNQNTLLKYYPHNSSWYRATVFINGKAQTGYIHKNDVEGTTEKVDKLKTVGSNNQLILVTSKGYNTNKVSIETYDRDSKGSWKLVNKMSGHNGKNGFSDNKREGDKKTPTGKYSIGTAFGQVGNPGTKLPFKNITNDDVWVDDSKSSLYNTWQSKSKTSHLWNSAENMNHRLYKYGFVINYNTKQTPYKGSAIFMHGSNGYTVGCVSTPEANMKEILKWLDPAKNPVIIQTPEEALKKY